MRGEPRVIRDGRTSPASRTDWYAGWDEQDRLSQPPPTQEQQQESQEALAGIKAYLASQGFKK